MYSACTSRVEYQYPDSAVSPDAININVASADEIERLPHVGPKTAEAIVQFRSEHGPFRRREELLQIRGMSENRFLQIRDLVRTQ